MSLQPPQSGQAPQPEPTIIQAPAAASSTLPPVMIYLPGISKSPANSASRMAELIAIKANNGPGTYAAEAVPSPSAHLTDGRRIVRAGSDPALDVYTLDYRPRLQRPRVAGDGILAATRRFALAVWYFLRALVLVLRARKRAKSGIAKWQLVLGFGAAFVLLLAAVFTFFAMLAALELWSEPVVSDTADDAIALGATAITTWAFVKLRPVVDGAAVQVAQFLDYVQHERHAAGIAMAVNHALDDLLEADGDRRVHLFGYSLGALVAVDFLYPRAAMHPTIDPRHAKVVSTLITVGFPLDFVRLYMPNYTNDRMARIPGLSWTNVYIAADVFGSNLIDDNDFTDSAEAAAGRQTETPVTTTALADEPPPVSRRYTNERLTLRNIWGYRGFLSHGGYWDEPENENCLHLVT